MKLVGVLGMLLVASVARVRTLSLAEECDPAACRLPNCRCSGTDIPGGLNPRDIPQFVTVTFDDGINVNNIVTYRQTLYDRTNANGCRAGVTFFVSHEYTNYALVNELYNQGFEIALHSISHKTPQDSWRTATLEDMHREFGDQKTQLSYFANIPFNSIKGIRIPYLQMIGNYSFEMMREYGLEYDCTWISNAHTNPALWPYTLDYASTQDCVVPPCPTASFPGLWVKPMTSWVDQQRLPCSMVDGCYYEPPRTDEDAWYRFILENFERHYMGTRAPFPFFVHEAMFTGFPATRRAFVRFLDTINSLNDVFMVNAYEVIEWVKNPVSIETYRRQGCRSFQRTNCIATNCGPLSSSHLPWTLDYWMGTCTSCPRVYPWVNNPLGL